MKLSVHDVDPERAERVRARCVAALAARPPRGAARSRWGSLEPAVALALGVLYLADAVARAVAVCAPR